LIELGCGLALLGLLCAMGLPSFYRLLMRAERHMTLERYALNNPIYLEELKPA